MEGYIRGEGFVMNNHSYVRGEGFVMRLSPYHILGRDKDGNRFEEIDGDRFIEMADENGERAVYLDYKGNAGQLLLKIEGLKF